MKKTLLLCLSLLAFNAVAASPVWVVEGDGNKLFLAGTVHVLREADYPLPAAFEQAYRQSQSLAFEIDIDQTRSPQFIQRMANAFKLPEGVGIEQLLSPETLQRLALHLRSNGLSLQQFKGLKPSMIATTLTMFELRKLGAAHEGVDTFYQRKATEDGKQVLALESAEEQIVYLSKMGDGHEDLMIQQTLDDVDSLAGQFQDMLTAWRQGDNKMLQKLFVDSLQRDFAPLYQELLVERNHNWLPQLLQYLDTPATEMVLVGSAHLVGEDGLLQMLESKGYRVSQLD